MRKSLFFLLILMGILITCSISQATLLGPASDYNVFLFGDMNVWESDSEGRIAVGGNIIRMSNYAIGLKADPAQYSIVSGANVNFGSGSVSNGGIFAEGNIQLNHFYVDGDVTSNGTISGVGQGTIEGNHTQNAAAASPIDFASAYTYLSSTSLLLAKMAPTGTTSVTYWGTRDAIVLTGAEDINIFSLSGNDLSNASSLTFNIGADDIAIVNVSGKVDNFSGFGLFGYDKKQGNILYNFYEADQLTMHNIGIMGSILAPDADVIFNTGVINGTLIADSLTGSGQSNQSLFHHDVPVTSVPEPAPAILLGCGLAGIFIFRRKMKRSAILLQERFSPGESLRRPDKTE